MFEDREAGRAGSLVQERVPERTLAVEIFHQLNDTEQKARCSLKLQKTLQLDGSPVAVAIVAEPPEGLKSLRRKLIACMMIQAARRGIDFYSSGESILCGARAHLGIGESPIRNLDDFLVRREKLFGSKEAAGKFIESALKRAPEKGKYLAFSPLERACFVPDLVLFVGTPLQISRLIFLNAFKTGEVDLVHGEPLCSGAIALPVTTGKIGISFMDMACRQFGKFMPEEMVIGVPYAKILRIIESIDQSVAGTARPDIILRLAGIMLRKSVPDRSG